MSVSKILDDVNNIYQDRNKVYGDTYKIHGDVMAALFPHDVNLHTNNQHMRFGVLSMIVSKLTRICQNFHTGHEDSLLDLITYSAMLKELYNESDSV